MVLLMKFCKNECGSERSIIIRNNESGRKLDWSEIDASTKSKS